MTLVELKRSLEDWLHDINADIVSDEEDEFAHIKTDQERTVYKKSARYVLETVLNQLDQLV